MVLYLVTPYSSIGHLNRLLPVIILRSISSYADGRTRGQTYLEVEIQRQGGLPEDHA